MKPLFLVLLVSIALGAAYLFTRSGLESDPAAAGLGATSGDLTVAPAEMDSPRLDAVAQGDGSDRGQAQAAIPATKRGGTKPAAAAFRTEPEVTGIIRGRITDADGVGLAGGDVHAQPARGLLSNRRRDQAARTKAEDDGRFELTVPAGSLRLVIGLDGYAPMTQSAEARSGETVDLGDVRLAHGVRISGRVTNDRGLPVEGASLHRQVESSGGLIQLGALGALAATTDAGGHFEILRQAPGPFRFAVDHADHLRGSLEGATEFAGEVAHGLEVVLEQGVSIAGIVLELPEDLEATSFRALARREGAGPDAGAFMFDSAFDSSNERSGTVAKDGSFEIRGLAPAARYEVWIQLAERAWASGVRRSERVAARSGDTGVRVAYSEGASLIFALQGQNGEPVSEPTIRGGFSFQREFEGTALSEVEGTHALRHIWSPEVPKPFQITVEARGFETYKHDGVTIPARGEVDLGVITLKPKPQLEVTVLDASTGAPVEGAKVSLEKVSTARATGTRITSRSVSIDLGDASEFDFSMLGKDVQTTDEEGKCTLDVEPGTSVHVDVVHSNFSEIRTDPVRIGSGKAITETLVKLLPGGSVNVLVTDHLGSPVQSAKVQRRGEDDRPSPTRVSTGPDGRALLTGLAPGVHGLRLAANSLGGGMVAIPGLVTGDAGAPWTEVTVEPGATTDTVLRAEPPMHVVGTITEAGVPLAGAKIRLRGAASTPGFPSFLGGGDSTKTDARGRFRLEDVKGGASTLVVAHATRAMDYEHSLEVEAGENEVDLDLGVTIVEGVVLDHGGEPLAGAKVKVSRPAAAGTRAVVSFVMTTDDGDEAGDTFISGGSGEPEPVFTDADGRYSLRGVQAGVEFAVSATADGYDTAKSESLTLDGGEVRSDVDLAFVLTGSIRIDVERGQGRAMAILQRRGGSVTRPRIEPFSGVSKTVDGLAPGIWTVRLNSMGAADARFAPEEHEVEVIAGEEAQAVFERTGG